MASNAIFRENLAVLRKKVASFPGHGFPEAGPAESSGPVRGSAALPEAIYSGDAVMVCGAGAESEILEIHRLTRTDYFTKRRPLYLVCEHARDLRPWLASQALRPVFADPRVFFFCADLPETDVGAFFRAVSSRPLPTGVFCCGAAPDFYEGTVRLVQTLHEERTRKIRELSERVGRRYAPDRRLRVPRCLETGAPPLKILSFTSRFTAYVQHCVADCADGFRRLGHEARVWIEPTDMDRLNGLVVLEELDKFDPDLVFDVDHTRHEHGALFPRDLPFVTWMQDELPDLLSAETAARIHGNDFVFCSGGREELLRRGYPAAQVFEFMECSNPARFSPGPVSARTRERFGAEISFVSHASTPPEEEWHLLKRELAQARAGMPVFQLLERFYRRVGEEYAQNRVLWSKLAYLRLLESLEREKGFELEHNVFRDWVVHRFFHRIGNRFLRQLPLEWASEAGLDLKIWGQGWDRHPRLSRHAAGVAAYGEDLRNVFRASRINLHQSHFHDIIHPRLLDCLNAGGCVLIRTDIVKTHRHPFLHNCFWFETREDFLEKTSFLLDSAHRSLVGSRLRAMRAYAREGHGYEVGMGRILEMVATRVWWDGCRELAARSPAGPVTEELSAALRRHFESLRHARYVAVQTAAGLRARDAADSLLPVVRAFEALPAAKPAPLPADFTRACAHYRAGRYEQAEELAVRLCRTGPAFCLPVVALLRFKAAFHRRHWFGIRQVRSLAERLAPALDMGMLRLSGCGEAYLPADGGAVKMPGRKAAVGRLFNGMIEACSRMFSAKELRRLLVETSRAASSRVPSPMGGGCADPEGQENLTESFSLSEILRCMQPRDGGAADVALSLEVLRQLQGMLRRAEAGKKDAFLQTLPLDAIAAGLARTPVPDFSAARLALWCMNEFNCWTWAERLLALRAKAPEPESVWDFIQGMVYYYRWRFEDVLALSCEGWEEDRKALFQAPVFWGALHLRRWDRARAVLESEGLRTGPSDRLRVMEAALDCVAGNATGRTRETLRDVQEARLPAPARLIFARCCRDCGEPDKALAVVRELQAEADPGDAAAWALIEKWTGPASVREKTPFAHMIFGLLRNAPWEQALPARPLFWN